MQFPFSFPQENNFSSVLKDSAAYMGFVGGHEAAPTGLNQGQVFGPCGIHKMDYY